MPVYTYRCDNCGVRFERQQKFSDQPLTRCPECSKKTLRKVYQPVGIVFKGSGFYSTDHRSPSGSNRIGNGKSGEGEGLPSHEGKPSPSEGKATTESKSASGESSSSGSASKD